MSSKDLLNIAQLRAFKLVADTGSATRAASALFRAQSAVTRSVQELEAALGEPLFDRKPSGMLPTPVGRAVLHRCERLFTELEELAQWCAARQARRRTAAEGSLPAYLLNTRRLQLFAALARHRHMPSAAKAFGISQPAVSTAIRVLESGSGLQLIDFKTGKNEEDEDSLQLPIYALLVKNCQNRPVNKISYWYLESDNNPKEMPFPDLEKAHEKVLTIAKQIRIAREKGNMVCPKGGCFACRGLEQIVAGKAKFLRTEDYQDIFILPKGETGANYEKEDVMPF